MIINDDVRILVNVLIKVLFIHEVMNEKYWTRVSSWWFKRY